MNLEELTNSYLRDSNRNSIQNKITSVCLRVQQGINFRRSDARSLRYSPFLVEQKGTPHTPESIQAHLNRFEENFPIIDRITGSRQVVSAESLTFDPNEHGLTEKSLSAYMEEANEYLENSQRLARQIRIIIVPGCGPGSFESVTNSLCIPLYPPASMQQETTLLSALADFLYQVKFVNESCDREEELLDIINKKSKSRIKSGTHESKLKITHLLNQELIALMGIKQGVINPPNISNILGQIILGADNTMIYRELRHLSAPQKQARMKLLRDKYSIGKRNIPMDERVALAVRPQIPVEVRDKLKKDLKLSLLYHRLPDHLRIQTLDELYDLATLHYHYEKVNEGYLIFELIIKLSPECLEAFWGLGTCARHQEMTEITPAKKTSVAISAFRRFIEFPETGIFWKNRSLEIIKKLSGTD
ncbi:MAG: hypothetical protein HQL32_17805 [Planctomycetes bacterium]|nr:hypothetical protein [Planctomycetota bacterium]